MRPVIERAVTFDCGGETLVGVVHVPDAPADAALVIVVGGPQYRVGSHRQFVQLARTVSSAGYAVLRFDCRGMGDSSGAPRAFETLTDDIRAAIETVQRHVRGVRRVVLWGLCDGASAALLYWDETRDPRVHALCLANPWVRSDASLARTHMKHYYGQRLMQRAFWAKLLQGRVAARALRDFMRSASRSRGVAAAASAMPPFQDRMARAWQSFDGRMLLLLSADDYTAREFVEYAGMAPAWSGALGRDGLQRRDLALADHTFSAAACRVQAEDATLEWLVQGFPAARAQRGMAFVEQEHG